VYINLNLNRITLSICLMLIVLAALLRPGSAVVPADNQLNTSKILELNDSTVLWRSILFSSWTATSQSAIHARE
jgi:hypothetical protein